MTKPSEKAPPEQETFCSQCEKPVACEEVTGRLCDTCWLEKVELDNVAAFGLRNRIV